MRVPRGKIFIASALGVFGRLDPSVLNVCHGGGLLLWEFEMPETCQTGIATISTCEHTKIALRRRT
jgi:hypothetical protein